MSRDVNWVTTFYEWTNFVLQIVITSQSNPLNWCWYSNSRKKNWKDNGVGYGVVKIFLRSRLAVVKVLAFPQPGRETRQNPNLTWKFSQIVCNRAFSRHLLRKIRGKCENFIQLREVLDVFCRAARRYRPCNILKIRARMRSVFLSFCYSPDVFWNWNVMFYFVDRTFDAVTESGRSTTRPVPVIKSNNSTIVLYRKQVTERQLRSLL